MAQLGVKKMSLGDRVVEVPIYDPADCAYPVRRIAPADGVVGCLPVFPLGEGNLAFEERRFYHPTYGVMAYHDQPVLMTTLTSFEFSTSTLHSNWSTPYTTDQVGTESYSGALDGSRVAFVGRNTSTAGFWTVPAHNELPMYPAPGKRFAWHFRLTSWPYGSGAQTWFTFGGTTDIVGSNTDNTLYEVNLIEGGSIDSFRLRTRRVDSSGNVQELYTSASAYETHGGNRPKVTDDRWYCVLVDWYDATADGRTGVRARLYDTVLPDPEVDSPIQYGSFDTADYGGINPDGSGDIPQEPGRMGARQSGSGVDSRWDSWVMYPDR